MVTSRAAGLRYGDHHALAHTAGQLVRETVDALFRQRNADHAHELHRPRLRFRAAQPLMQPEYLGNLEPAGEHRVQRRHGLLKDHGDLIAADLPHLIPRQGEQVSPLKAYGAGYLRGRRL